LYNMLRRRFVCASIILKLKALGQMLSGFDDVDPDYFMDYGEV